MPPSGNNKNIIKKAMFLLIMALLVLPALQKEVFKIPERSLKGAVVSSQKPVFKWKNWFSGEYQSKYDDYLEDHIGFRNFLVRLNNQMDYSMFNQINAKGVLVGKENYLYETNYIKGYLGLDFLGEEAIKDKIKKIGTVQRWLEQQGVVLLPLFAPGKGNFYPEYFPAPYDTMSPSPITNHSAYTSGLIRNSVGILDYNTLFGLWKDTSSHILYPRYGIHWSTYGVGLALDTLMKRLEYETGKDLVDFGWDEVVRTRDLRYDDYDVAEGMNLLLKLPCDEMSYPRFYYRGEEKYRPKVLVIGDSFFWQILGQGHAQKLFGECTFWYYNSQGFSTGATGPVKMDKAYLAEKLRKYDVIMTLYTEANLPKMANDFYENAYYALKYEDKIQDVADRIKGSPEWLAKVREKAEARDIPLEEMVWLDALWVVQQNND